MATLSTPKPELDDGIQEEIEVLIEDYERLIDASREKISRPTNGGGGADFWKVEDPTHYVDRGYLVDEESEKDESPKEGIFVGKSIDKMVTATKTKKRKQSIISRASKVVVKSFKPRQTEQQASPPPPLLLATTFDTEPSSGSDDEDRDRNGYSSSASGDVDHNVTLVTQGKKNSRMSGTDIPTIMEEQQEKREHLQARIQLEQEDNDEGLQHLQDDSESGTNIYSKSQDETSECLEKEVGHSELVSEIALEINSGDGSMDLVPVGDESGDNTVTITSNTNLAAEEETSLIAMRAFWKKAEKELSSPFVKDTSQGVIAAVEDEDEPSLLTIRKIIRLQEENEVTNISVTKVEKSLSLPLVKNSFFTPMSEDITCVADKETIIVTAPPPSPIPKPIWLGEEEGLLGPFIGTDQLSLDPAKESLLVSQRVLFEDHSEELAAHDYIDHETEGPSNSDPSQNFVMNKEADPEPLSFLTISLSTSSASMAEMQSRRDSSKCHPSGVYGDFTRLKHIVLVVMMCAVAGIGSIGHWSDRCLDSPSNKMQVSPNENIRPEPAPVVNEGLAKRQHKAKKNNQIRDIDLDEFHSILW